MRVFRKLWLDTVLATAFVFGIMLSFQNIGTFKIFDIFDPIADAIDDFKPTDIVFSQLRSDPIADERIVLINVAKESRGGIAVLVSKINQFKPAVIGMDTFFDVEKDTLKDRMLAEALKSAENLVMASKPVFIDDDDTADSVITSVQSIAGNAHYGFASLITDAKNQQDLKFCRSFYSKITDHKNKEHLPFAVELTAYIDSAAYLKFLSRPNDVELINYKGNILDYGATKFGTKYMALDVMDVYMENFTPEMINGKIVLFCFLGEYLGDQENFEDKFITPLNSKYVGRTLPDMYGGVIHANIASMVLTGDYIEEMSNIGQVAIAVFLCLLNVYLFSCIYKSLPNWYDGITKIIQPIELIIFYFLMVQIFDQYSYYADLSMALIAIALCGDALEVYYGVIKNIFKKDGRKTLFKMKKI